MLLLLRGQLVPCAGVLAAEGTLAVGTAVPCAGTVANVVRFEATPVVLCAGEFAGAGSFAGTAVNPVLCAGLLAAAAVTAGRAGVGVSGAVPGSAAASLAAHAMALAAAARFGAVPRLVSAGRLTAVTFVHVRLPASGQELVQVDTGPTAVQLTSGVGRAALWPSDAAAAVVNDILEPLPLDFGQQPVVVSV